MILCQLLEMPCFYRFCIMLNVIYFFVYVVRDNVESLLVTTVCAM